MRLHLLKQAVANSMCDFNSAVPPLSLPRVADRPCRKPTLILLLKHAHCPQSFISISVFFI